MSAWKDFFVWHGLVMSLILTTVATPAASASQQATVILSEDCKYLLLNAKQGMVLVKQLEGATPRVGDTLSGELTVRDFSHLHNGRDNSDLRVWVDLVDPHNSKALSQYGRYCT